MDPVEFWDRMEICLVAGICLGALAVGWVWSRLTAIGKRLRRMDEKLAEVAEKLEAITERMDECPAGPRGSPDRAS